MIKQLLKYFFLVSILSFSLFANGQANYKNGYIITNSQDTVFGRINDRGDYRNTQACYFKEGKKGKAIKYYPKDIKAYRMIGDKYYMSRQVIKKGIATATFVEVLIDGKVNLYYYVKGKKTSFYIEKENSDQLIGLTNEKISDLYHPLPDTPVSYSKDYYLTNKAYLDTLSSVFRDDRKIQKSIYGVTYYRKSLMKITKNYIKDVCKGKDCITYEKNITRNNPRIGIFTGVQVSQLTFSPYKSQSIMFKTDAIVSNPIGAFVNVPLPIISERLSVQLEFIDHRIHYSQPYFTQIEGIELNSTPISVPLLLKYEITKAKFSPSVAFGTEAKFARATEWRRERGDGAGWFGEIGVDYKIYKKLSMFANLRVESKKHYLSIDEDLMVRYLDYNPKVMRLGLADINATTNSAALYFGIRF